KTTHLAQLMDDRGRIVAVDPQPSRLDRVKEAAARLGGTIVQTIGATVQDLVGSHGAHADAVLVDAPCTNLGGLARQHAGERAGGRRAIRPAGGALAKSGARLVYATCSPEPDENDAVVAAFLAAQPAWRLDAPAVFPLPLDTDGYLRTRPDRHDTDAFTAVRLRRAGGGAALICGSAITKP